MASENCVITILYCSDAVRIVYGEGRGRYAVASRDVEVGELIAVETAFVALLDKEPIQPTID